ncbi:MAG: AsnC family transcriptional regulator [Methylococcales bacterium]
MDEVDKQIINHLQGGFPVCDSPYQVVAEQLGLTEASLIYRIKRLLDTGLLSRFGPLFHAEQMGGALTLAAVKAPEQQFDQIADIINSFPEVAHNYARSHELNMWFVIATNLPERLSEVIDEIQQQTQLRVYNMPKINEYFVGLKLQA